MTINEEFAKKLRNKLIHGSDNLYILYLGSSEALTLKKIVTLEKLGYRLRFPFVENRRIGFLFEKKEASA